MAANTAALNGVLVLQKNHYSRRAEAAVANVHESVQGRSTVMLHNNKSWRYCAIWKTNHYALPKFYIGDKATSSNSTMDNRALRSIPSCENVSPFISNRVCSIEIFAGKRKYLNSTKNKNLAIVVSISYESDL